MAVRVFAYHASRPAAVTIASIRRFVREIPAPLISGEVPKLSVYARLIIMLILISYHVYRWLNSCAKHNASSISVGK